MACTAVIKMKHQGKCYMNVSANSPPLCVSLPLPEDFSFGHSFLKYLRGKLGVDILPFHRHAAHETHWGNFTAVPGNGEE